jgi:hypothetical protein
MLHKVFKSTIVTASVSCLLFSCAPKKKAIAAPVVEAPKIQMPKVEPEVGNLVPFTRELFFKLRENGLDIKKLKFYVENTVVLNKIATSGNLDITENGILVNKKGLAENIIKITPQVAGMVESVENDGLRLNFGRPNSNLKFFNTAAQKNFTFSGDKFDKMNGTVEVPYNNSTYKANCEGCSNVTDVKLLIKQLDIEAGMGNGTIEKGAGNRGF